MTSFAGPEVPQFGLTDNGGNAFSEAGLIGKWTLMFFGYTRCPDVCPMTMAALARTYEQLGSTAITAAVQVVMISVDPKHDTAQIMDSYVRRFNDSFIGLTGQKEEVNGLARKLGISIMQPDVEQDHGHHAGTQLVSHTPTVLLVSPEAKVARLFTAPYRPHKLATTLTEIITKR